VIDIACHRGFEDRIMDLRLSKLKGLLQNLAKGL